jgi:EAL domain-containing protein (putative c-di-GMP-specific phosphodiesterase class I)
MHSREALLREIQRLNKSGLSENQLLLTVVSVADIKKYDQMIEIFGYKFADDMLVIRMQDLRAILPDVPIYQVGFWSFGFIFDARQVQDHLGFLNRLVADLARPVICRGVPLPIRAGVGVCDLKHDFGSAEDLLQSAFLAGQVSSSAATSWRFCKAGVTDDHRRAFSLISDVAPALTTPDEFELQYQGRIDLLSHRCTGVEALLRWRHPTLGVVSPAEFIPLVEMTGFIRPLTSWVLRRALAQAQVWHARGAALHISVNISAKNLEEEDFVPLLEENLKQHGLAPEFLELEFAASSLFFDQDAATAKMRALRTLGVNIATDDFGTGQNSFVGLAATPANIIKIDRSHICALGADARSRVIVKSMIEMAHGMGMTVVGKGVETQPTFDMLTELACDYAQGYLMCRPMFTDEFDAWYAKTFA